MLTRPVQPLHTEDNFIIFAGDSLVPTSASAACLEMMGKSASQLAMGGVNLHEYFPQLHQLVIAAAAEHDEFADKVNGHDDDDLPSLDDTGNYSVVMCPGSQSYSSQISLGGTHRVQHRMPTSGRQVEGFAVQARVQILGFPSSLIKKKQSKKGGGRRNGNGTGNGSAINATPVHRVCILRWRLCSTAGSQYEMVDAASGAVSGRHTQGGVRQATSKARHTPRHAAPPKPVRSPRMMASEAHHHEVTKRYSTTDNLLANIMEGVHSGRHATESSTSTDPRTDTQSPGHEGDGSDGQNDHDSLSVEANHDITSMGGEQGADHDQRIVVHGESKEGSSPYYNDIPGSSREPIETAGPLTDGSVHSYVATKPDGGMSLEEEGDEGMEKNNKHKGVRWDEGSVIKGNRSVDTGGTGSTASSGLSVLRSHLDRSQRRIMEPALKALRNTVILVLAMASVLAMGIATMNSIMMSNFNKSLDSVDISGDRLYYGADIALHVQELSMMWAGDIVASDERFKQSQIDLEGVAVKLEKEHKALYLGATEEEVCRF